MTFGTTNSISVAACLAASLVVDQTAIETSLVGRVRLTVRTGLHLTWPRAETPTHYITIGMDRDLTQATRIQRQALVVAWVALEHVALGFVEPRDDDEFIADGDAVQGVRDRGIDVEPGVGCALATLSRRVGA